MRATWLVIPMALSLALGLTNAGSAADGAGTRDAIEQEIRRLDAQEADAVLRGDFALIDELWADDFIVNNPSNKVGLGRAGPVRKGVVAYSSFERVPEVVSLRGDVVFVMGHEVVVPKAPADKAGQTLRRRYTNVWIRTDRGWKLAARHANVISAVAAHAPRTLLATFGDLFEPAGTAPSAIRCA